MTDPDLVLAERIAHERELRAAEAKAFEHERELRMLYDEHERELRHQVEAAVAANLERQAVEYERRLSALNGEQARIAVVLNQSVTRELFDLEMKHTLEKADALRRQTDERAESLRLANELLAKQVDRLVTQLATLRSLAVFIGLPGIVAFIWTLLAAVANVTVTGPGGFVP